MRLQVLARCPKSLDQCYTALQLFLRDTLQLPAPLEPSGWAPRPSGTPQIITASLPLSSQTSLDLYAFEGASSPPFSWGPSVCHLMGVDFGGGEPDTLQTLSALRATPASRVSSALHSLGLGMPLSLPRSRLTVSSSPPLAAPPPASSTGHGGLKEVVLGCEDGEPFATTQALAGIVARRDREVLSVWRTQAGPHLRLIPSLYSAIVFHPGRAAATSQEEEVEEDPLRAVRDSLASRSIPYEMYGVRMGSTTVTGQLQLLDGALAGLDVRVCPSGLGPSHHFNEARATLTDVMDPSLNANANKEVPLACKSIVGMDLVSTLRLRFTGRVG